VSLCAHLPACACPLRSECCLPGLTLWIKCRRRHIRLNTWAGRVQFRPYEAVRNTVCIEDPFDATDNPGRSLALTTVDFGRVPRRCSVHQGAARRATCVQDIVARFVRMLVLCSPAVGQDRIQPCNSCSCWFTLMGTPADRLPELCHRFGSRGKRSSRLLLPQTCDHMIAQKRRRR